jgi:hypothetical protein
VAATGWQVAGVDGERLIADALSLIRPATARNGGTSVPTREEFPPFVRITRTVNFDLDWTIENTIERLAPEHGAFSLRIPLLPGESVLTAGLPVHDGAVEVALPAGVAQTGWKSSLARTGTLALAAPVDAPYVEVWRLAVGPSWHVEAAGTPEVYSSGEPSGVWIRRFEPRPGEKLNAAITRPAAVRGPSFAFESVTHTVTTGRRSTDTSLVLGYRSTQGERHTIRLPAGARLQSVIADGQPLTLRDQDGELALPLMPGTHEIGVSWQAADGIALAARPGVVDLGAPATNVSTTIGLPANHWILFAAGGGVGPAILYWAELAVFIALALLLTRLRRTPLAAHEWLLVGLGLSTFSWSVLVLFAVWVFVLDWRSRWHTRVEPWVFNGVQLLLVLLTVAALGSLLAAIPNGLLGTPDMRIAGPAGHGGLLEWFHDRVDRQLPRPVVISVSIWFYKAAILAWALWLSFALVRWVRWGWDAFSAERLWVSPRPRSPAATEQA